MESLKALVKPVTGGDPMTEAKYTRRSLRTLSGELADLGHIAGPDTVADLLRDLGYRLRSQRQALSGPYHPDRDEQFTFIEGLVAAFREDGLPILSVDTKKKELVGNFKNAGATWRREADEVNAHDFPSDALYRVARLRAVRPAGQQGARRSRHLGRHALVRGRGGSSLVVADRLPPLPGRPGVADPG